MAALSKQRRYPKMSKHCSSRGKSSAFPSGEQGEHDEKDGRNGYPFCTNCSTQAQPKGNYIAVPNTSSQRRRYIPMGFLTDYVIGNNGLSIIPDATLYHFGILESNVHMAWMRTVAGRLKSDYRYSKNIVYNTFPWPTPTQAQKDRIEKSAQGILDARKNHPEDSLADLYDPRFMPQDLRPRTSRMIKPSWPPTASTGGI